MNEMLKRKIKMPAESRYDSINKWYVFSLCLAFVLVPKIPSTLAWVEMYVCKYNNFVYKMNGTKYMCSCNFNFDEFL